MKKLKWITVAEYIDRETGEIISKSLYEREYIKIKTIIKTEINEYYGIRNYQIECEKSKQTKIEF